MTEIHVVWKSYHKETPNRGYWDQAMLERLFKGDEWTPPGFPKFISHDDFDSNIQDGAIVIIPAMYHVNDLAAINADIAKLPWCLFIIAGDEHSLFPAEKLSHPNMKVWRMTPKPGADNSMVDRFIGEGAPQDAIDLLRGYKDRAFNREYDWFFSGQVSHKRREECVETLRNMPRGFLLETAGFTQGLPHDQYYGAMANSKVVPCPSGPGTVDSFRLFEALEAGCVPLADTKTPKDIDPVHYWELLFGDPIFPVVKNWDEAAGTTQYHVDIWPRSANRIFAWWQAYKRQLAYSLMHDLAELRGKFDQGDGVNDNITVIVPTSPIPKHPDTSVIEETITTIRSQLPLCEIIIMIDGVRAEQEYRSSDYENYINRLLWLCNHEWQNVLPVIFNEHKHQAQMTKEVLPMINTPYLLFVEHDTPITPDQHFPWREMCDAIAAGHANMIRFHFEAQIPEVHKHLMLDEVPEIVCGVPMVRTAQWSQRPHLASVEFYKRIINENFSTESRTMIEDKMHGILYEAFMRRSRAGWNDYKVWIFTPEGNIKRSYHLDGRESDPKYEMKF